MRADTRLPPYLPYPRFLLQADLTQTAKLLYALLLDRATLSQSNGWLDESGRIYLVFPIEKIAAALDRSPMTVKNALSELEDAGLIERRRSGFSKPNRIYVKMPPDGQKTFQVTDRNPSSIEKENCPTDGQKIVPMMERKLSPNNLSSSNLNQNHLSRESEAPTTYGRYENVFLTESEYAELLRDFPDRLDRLISELSSYMESTGRSYQNHAATIRRWAENDKTKGVPKQGIPDYTCNDIRDDKGFNIANFIGHEYAGKFLDLALLAGLCCAVDDFLHPFGGRTCVFSRAMRVIRILRY